MKKYQPVVKFRNIEESVLQAVQTGADDENLSDVDEGLDHEDEGGDEPESGGR